MVFTCSYGSAWGPAPTSSRKYSGVPSAIQVDIEKVALPELDTPLSVAVRTIIDDIRTQRHKCMRVSQTGCFSTENMHKIKFYRIVSSDY
jgi:hypothetical protein